MKRITIILIILVFTSSTYSQSVEIKDDENHTLITINDEGTAGSITIPDAITVGTTANKLYNEGSTLMWDGNNLSTSSPIWLLNGNKVYYNLGNVGIGVSDPQQKLQISAGHIQLDENYGLRLITTGGNANRIYSTGNNLQIMNFASGVAIDDAIDSAAGKFLNIRIQAINSP